MSTLLSDAAMIEAMGRTPWPDDVRLFQQYEVEQILMPDFASCLSVKAFLNMCQLSFQTELRHNAEFMSPTGELPVVKVGSVLLSDFDMLVTMAGAKGHSLSKDLKEEQRAEMKAYISLVHNSIGNALQYILWCDKETRNLVSKPRYASAYRWPLSKILPLKKQLQVIGRLKAIGWATLQSDEVYPKVDTCCQALSAKLAGQRFFFGNSPTELDAVVFGYLYTILTTMLPSTKLVDLLSNYKNLNDFCVSIHDQYFKDSKKSI